MDVVGGDSQRFAHWLALPELLHVGSLIIDDVQDDSDVRRGGPSCHMIHGTAARHQRRLRQLLPGPDTAGAPRT